MKTPLLRERGRVLALGLSAASLSLLLLSCTLGSWKPTGYALVYGVTVYDPAATGAVTPNLQFPDDDATDLASLLTSKGYKVILRTDGDSSPNGPASLSQLQTDVQTVENEIGPDDNFIFYFSGHGGPDALGHSWIYLDGSISGPPGGYYISPTGSIVANIDFTKTLDEDGLGTLIAKIDRTSKKIVILDSCNSGGFIGQSTSFDGIPPEYDPTSPSGTPGKLEQSLSLYLSYPGAASNVTGVLPQNAIVLAAAGADESSYEYGAPFNHGVMTYFLLQTAQSADANHDGYVTTSEAFDYVEKGIEQVWNDTVVANDPSAGPFMPHESGGPIDFVLFTAG